MSTIYVYWAFPPNNFHVPPNWKARLQHAFVLPLTEDLATRAAIVGCVTFTFEVNERVHCLGPIFALPSVAASLDGFMPIKERKPVTLDLVGRDSLKITFEDRSRAGLEKMVQLIAVFEVEETVTTDPKLCTKCSSKLPLANVPHMTTGKPGPFWICLKCRQLYEETPTGDLTPGDRLT